MTVSRGALLDKIRSQFFLVHEHHYDWTSLENMTPLEFDLQIVLVLEYLKNLKDLQKTQRIG